MSCVLFHFHPLAHRMTECHLENVPRTVCIVLVVCLVVCCIGAQPPTQLWCYNTHAKNFDLSKNPPPGCMTQGVAQHHVPLHVCRTVPISLIGPRPFSTVGVGILGMGNLPTSRCSESSSLVPIRSSDGRSSKSNLQRRPHYVWCISYGEPPVRHVSHHSHRYQSTN